MWDSLRKGRDSGICTVSDFDKFEFWDSLISQRIQWASSEIWRSNSVLWSLCFCINCWLKSPRCPNHFHSPQMIDCEFAFISNCASMSKIKIVLLFAWILLSVLFAMKFGAIPDLVGLDKVEVPFIVIPWAMILAFGIYRLKKKITSTTRAWAAAFLPGQSGWLTSSANTEPRRVKNWKLKANENKAKRCVYAHRIAGGNRHYSHLGGVASSSPLSCQGHLLSCSMLFEPQANGNCYATLHLELRQQHATGVWALLERPNSFRSGRCRARLDYARNAPALY